MIENKKWPEIKYSRPSVSVQDIVGFIDRGYKYHELKNEQLKTGELHETLSDEERLSIYNGILLSPDYQRDYRSTPKEESSIIESILLGIPIPEVFLSALSASTDFNIRQVMDGQHRLNAIYRFVKNKFSLSQLEISKELEGQKFKDLDWDNKGKILTGKISVLEFESLTSDYEIELFKRYNKNTKPLELQEITKATYYSNTNIYISNFINEEYESEGLFARVYNITKSRKEKQKNHQEISVIIYIILNGLKEGLNDGPKISEELLKIKALEYNLGKEDLKKVKREFEDFNYFIEKLSTKFEYPFSNEIRDFEIVRQNKFLLGVAIILATIFHYFEIDFSDVNKLVQDVQRTISLSPIGDETYKSSSTNSSQVINYLFNKNKIQNIEFESLKLKEDKRAITNNYLNN